MSKIRLRYVKSWVDRKTGKTYHRFRRRGFKESTLPGLPGSREFMAAYQAALDQVETPIGAKRTRAGTVNAAIVGYYQSLAFRDLAVGTQSMRRAILERFREEHGDRSMGDMPPKFIALTLNKLQPHAARNWFKAIRHLMQYAKSVGLCRVDPTEGLKLPKAKSTEHRAWTDAEIGAYERTHPIGSKARLAFALGYYTAQRRGDAIRMGRQHISADGFIAVRQEKTDAVLDVPVHPRLRTIIDAAAPADHLTFLVTKTGKPYSPNDFSEQFRQWCDAAELPSDVTFHGLRYSAGRVLADAGCSPHQIAAITGHKTLAMVQKYSKGTRQRRLASEAMAKRIANETAT
jgi:integrase